MTRAAGWRSGAPVALLAAASAFLLAPGLFWGEVPVFRDLLVLTLPLRLHAREAVRAGTFPLWTTDLFFGAPFFADYQAALLYPPSLLIYGLPFPFGFSVYLAFHLFAGGLGMFLYLRSRATMSLAASALGAVVFAFGGYLVTLVSLVNQLQVAAWLPWVLLAAEHVQERGRPSSVIGLALLVAMQALGGAPESLLLTLAVVGANAARQLAGTRALDRRFVVLCFAILVGLALAAVQLFPALEYAAQTDRAAGLPFEAVAAESLEPRSLWQFLLPHTFVDHAPFFVPEGGVPLFWSVYVGILPLALATIGWRSRPGGFWLALLGIGMLASLGSSTPLLRWLYGAFPNLVGAFRFPAKSFLVAHAALAWLAARGLDRALEDRRACRSAVYVLAALVLAGTALSAWALWSPRGLLQAMRFEIRGDLSDSAFAFLAGHVGVLSRRLAVIALGTLLLLELYARGRVGRALVGVLAVLITAADLLIVHRPSIVFVNWRRLMSTGEAGERGSAEGSRLFQYCTRSPGCLLPGAPGLGPWSGTLRPGEDVRARATELWKARVGNVPMVFGQGAVAGSDGFATGEQKELFRALALLPRDRAIHLLAGLGVSRLVGPEPLSDVEGATLTSKPSGPGNFWSYDLDDHAPRSYLAERIIPARDAPEAFARTAAADFRPGRDAVAGDTDQPLSGGSISNVAYREDSILAHLSLSGPGLWVICGTWFPGWQATLDDEPVEILRINGIQRGVRIPPGEHRVELRYRPTSLFRGTAVSALALATLLLYWMIPSRRHGAR